MKQILYIILISIMFSCNNHEENKIKVDRLIEILKICDNQETVKKLDNLNLHYDLGKLVSDSALINDLKSVRNETSILVDTLWKYRARIISNTGGIDDEGNYFGRDNKEYIDEVFIKPNGPSDNLDIMFKKYITFIREKGLQIDSLAITGRGIIYKYDKRFLDKELGYTYFKNATALEALIVLHLFSNEILRIEGKYLKSIMIKTSCNKRLQSVQADIEE